MLKCFIWQWPRACTFIEYVQMYACLSSVHVCV